MQRITVTASLNVPATHDAVWLALKRIRQYPHVFRAVSRIEKHTTGKLRVGSSWSETRRSAHGTHTRNHQVITLEPFQRLVTVYYLENNEYLTTTTLFSDEHSTRVWVHRVVTTPERTGLARLVRSPIDTYRRAALRREILRDLKDLADHLAKTELAKAET